MPEEVCIGNSGKSFLKVLIATFGCQMNVYDSQLAAGLLESHGFKVISEGDEPDELAKVLGRPSLSKGADIVLMNTCSVREHAEERIWGRLGMLGVEKKKRPELIIGLMGCMVEEHRERMFKRFPFLDLMIGTRNIKELPQMILEIKNKREEELARRTSDKKNEVSAHKNLGISRINQEGISIEYSECTKRDSPYHAWLPIMTGCDKECTFCIVPITRGHEVSMPAENVIAEARRLASKGFKWITLLGQNVNSYKGGSGESNNGEISFPKLLEKLCEIEELKRISFTTSHPTDATEDLFQVLASQEKLSRRFHLPLQSGSDRMLKRMKRYHNFKEYKDKVGRLRSLIPDIAITTDIIVGFSGETEEDFEETKQALREIRFDSAFIYKYSVRPGTPAARLTDDVSEEKKASRLKELLDLQKQISEEKSREAIGKIRGVFVENRNPQNSDEWVGRMDQDRRVLFKSKENLVGQFVKVRLTVLYHETFFAEKV